MDWLNVALVVLVPAVGSLLAWNWSLQNAITELRVSVAGQYHTKAELSVLLDRALEPVNRDLEEIKRLLRERDDTRNSRVGPYAPQHGRD